MKWAIICALLVAHSVWAEVAQPQLTITTPLRLAPPRILDIDGVFDRVLSAACIGIDSGGKIELFRRAREGRREKVALMVGKSHLMPVFDLNFRSASALARFAF